MLHLDYLSCFLTILATVLVSRKSWTGLLISIVNSMIVCLIGFRTAQFGFIPANLLCICVYAFSIRSWVKKIRTHRVRPVTVGTTETAMANAPDRQSSTTPNLRGSRVAAMFRPRRIIGNPALLFPVIRRSLLLEMRHRSIRMGGGRFPGARKLRYSKPSMQPGPSPAKMIGPPPLPPVAISIRAALS
jgi:hypothetical protein